MSHVAAYTIQEKTPGKYGKESTIERGLDNFSKYYKKGLNGHGHHSPVHGRGRHRAAAHHSGHHIRHQPLANSIVDTKALGNLEELGSNGEADDNGLVCIQKVMMIQETEYDEVMTCVHKYQERCHSTFTTVYEPHQV